MTFYLKKILVFIFFKRHLFYFKKIYLYLYNSIKNLGIVVPHIPEKKRF